ncbi:hypothetical protein OROHE_014495 [Orobanche hederae]
MESSSSARKFNSICIFGGASHGNEACFTEAAHNMGHTLGEKCIHIVYGGESLGLMGRTAASAYVEVVKVVGVIPKSLAESKIIGATIGDEFRAVNMLLEIKRSGSEVRKFLINAFYASTSTKSI